ncbi:Glu/Leu/Phe/Val family dehydrogenase [Arthrobacter rhombi]|uniref:Glu/Leu/Phe/Val family dehydrogenase n=1 Tax=Arthrobacter rhombi TaxID=71253 RepID=UPI003FCF92CD
MFDLIDDWGPEKVVLVSDTKTGMQGVLVIDNSARGMGKGGTRMQPNVSVQEVARLARTMTWKWAAADLFYGGAKAGIKFDPTSADKEAVLRSFVKALRNEVPREYVFGLDMGLTENDAAIINDELGDRGAAVGTPAELGGVAYDRLGVTGFGVAEAADQAATDLALPGKRVVIQGFGAVGHAAAKRFDELGYTVVGLSTAVGSIHAPDGLDIDRLLAQRAELGDQLVDEYLPQRIAPGSELFLDCDILVPAALQDVLTKDNAGDVRARLVTEGANLPSSDGARARLRAQGTAVVPDFIANAGGIVAAAYAMEGRYSAFRPDTAPIMATVSEKIRSNTSTVLGQARLRDTTTHEAAFAMARDRVRAAMDLRGARLGGAQPRERVNIKL